MDSVSFRARVKARDWRLLALVFLGMLLILSVLAYRQFWCNPPLGKGPAGPTVPANAFERAWTDRKVLLVGLGDSMTAGFGVAEDHGYFARLAVNPEDEYPAMQGICLKRVLPNLRWINLAVSGSTSLQHVGHIEQRLKTQDADIFGMVAITTGGNDIIHQYGREPPKEGAMYGAKFQDALPWIAAFEKRLDRMIDMIQARFPGGCNIFLGDIYDPTDGVGDSPNKQLLPPWPDGLKVLEAYNEILRGCAAKRSGVYAVPIHRTFLGHGTHCAQFWREYYRSDDPTYWYAANLEDPNDRGFDALRRIFLNEILKAADPSTSKSGGLTTPSRRSPGSSR